MLWSFCQQDIIDIWFITSRFDGFIINLEHVWVLSLLSCRSLRLKRVTPTETSTPRLVDSGGFSWKFPSCCCKLAVLFSCRSCLIKVGLMNHIVKQRQTCGSNQAQHTEGGEPTHGRSQSCCSLFWMSSFSHFHVYMLQMWHLLILPFSSVQFSSAEPH